jgi:phosphoribosylformylglycinamidine synthase
MDLLFGKAPKMLRDTQRPMAARWPRLETAQIDLREAALRVLSHPSVAAKSFLVTIGDRSVGGLVARDQMVGPWQLPLADCAITLTDFVGVSGEAMALGERTPLALIDAAAAARMAVGEAITNLAAAPVAELEEVKLSANWMAAASHPGEDALLFDAVRAVGMELCPALGIGIPVGKDSLSMQSRFHGGRWPGPDRGVAGLADRHRVRAGRGCTRPAHADAESRGRIRVVVDRPRRRATAHGWLDPRPVLRRIRRRRARPRRARHPAVLLRPHPGSARRRLLLAYHDRSDGGAFAALCEMAFASHLGLELNLDGWGEDAFRTLFNEELGAIVQVAAEDRAAFADLIDRHELTHCAQRIGKPVPAARVRVSEARETLAEWSWTELFDAWWSVTHAMQALRDEPGCADEERAAKRAFDAPPLGVKLGFDATEDVAAPFIGSGARPRVAILREQGVNGQTDMAAAFDRAGFAAVDVHMSDLIAGRQSLRDFTGLAACGGFSYGDVLGAGRGWATSILERPALRDQFAEFFARSDSFSLGVCNGCQMLSQLKALIPGAEHWPRFLRNRSEQFEARLALLEVLESPSLFLHGMAGSRLPVAVAHGEGRAEFDSPAQRAAARVALRYVEGDGSVATRYPANPNGSPEGITGLTSADGRSTLLMPHPERVFRSVQLSWRPVEWGEASPWLRMFRNARQWVG